MEDTIRQTTGNTVTPKESEEPTKEFAQENDGTPTPEIDYKEKFVNSARENQILAAKVASAERRLGEVNVENPTDAELRANFPDWDLLTDTERRMAVQTVTLRRQYAKLELNLAQMNEKASWNENFNEVLNRRNSDGSPAFPGLRERTDEFRAFCKKDKHQGLPFDVLAKSFLFEIKDELPTKPTIAPPKPSLNRGSGGEQPATTTTFTDEEAAKLRKVDPKRYNELVKKGVI